jgi:CubicO group peptidase (beta-lactamase class C family)
VTKLYLRFGCYWIAVLSIFTLTVSAQELTANQTEANWQENLKQIEKVLEKFKPENPGYQLSISRNGKIVFSKASGMANLEYNIPITKESVIETGSVSKQFTAAAILLLEQQGKLSTQDDIRKFIPELPDYGDKITLDHMMRHTSGLRDWGSIAAMSGWERSTKTYDNTDVLYIVARQKAVNFKPGERYLYSNSNYNLLAIVVERVSGMSLADYSKKYIFEPAGMTRTEWRNNFKKVVKNRAFAYSKSGDAYLTNMPNENAYGNGGLLTTTEDLLKWNDYYLSGKFGSPSLLDKQIKTVPFNNGKMNEYAAGLVINTVRGWKSINHNGATAGYRANLEYFPELNLSIAWLNNSSEFDGGMPAPVAVRNILVPDKSAPAIPITPITLSPEKLKAFEGWYREESWSRNSGIKLIVKDGKLTSSRGTSFTPVSEDTFVFGPNRLQFVESGKKIILTTPAETATYSAVEDATINDKTLAAYSGVYYSDETETKLTVKTKDGKLFLIRKPQEEVSLTPLYKDRFESPLGDIQFIKGQGSDFVEFEVSDGRSINVKFKKITK